MVWDGNLSLLGSTVKTVSAEKIPACFLDWLGMADNDRHGELTMTWLVRDMRQTLQDVLANELHWLDATIAVLPIGKQRCGFRCMMQA
jgi:phage gp37-like protein